MNKAEIGQLRSLAFEAMKSMKTYMDFGGDTMDLKVMVSFLKWPDVVLSMFDLMEEKEGALSKCVADLSYIMLQPLRVILEALLERHNLSEKEAYAKILSMPVNNEDMSEIVSARKAYIMALAQISKEVTGEGRNSGHS